jgi:C4-type Zn-finger protein
MKLIEMTWISRKDFEGILECEHCGQHQTLAYGYDDERFHSKVIPAIICVACGKRGNEIIPEGISDPGTSGGISCEQVEVSVKKWKLKR